MVTDRTDAARADGIAVAVASRFPWVPPEGIFLVQSLGIGDWREQGWKIHISATPSSALQTLERVLPVLLDFGVRFKVVASCAYLAEMNDGLFGESQVGKFITVYPSSDREAVNLATSLDERTSGIRGPRVPTDRRLKPGSLVHYRYGTFRRRHEGEEIAGVHVPHFAALLDASGRLSVDFRMPFYHPPSGIEDPFVKAGVYQPEPVYAGLLHDRYLVNALLRRTQRGPVLRAIDVVHRPCRLCVIKVLWPNVEADQEHGRPPRLAENEIDLLQRFSNSRALPQHYDAFERDGAYFVVNEWIEGEPLPIQLARCRSEDGWLEYSDLVDVATRSARALHGLHRLGIVFRDFKPENIIVTPHGEYQLIDFGIACDAGAAPRSTTGVGTPPFFSLEQFHREMPHASDDVFSWGAVMHLLATGSAPHVEPGMWHPRERPALHTVRLDLPVDFTDLVDAAVGLTRDRRPPDFCGILSVLEQSAIKKSSVHASSPVRSSQGLAQIGPARSAVAIGDRILELAEARTEGCCWRTRNGTSGASVYSADLYDGAAGIGTFLVELFSATGDTRFDVAARRAAQWLCGGTWGRGRASPGFQCGEAGVGDFCLRLSTLSGELGFTNAAAIRAGRLAGVEYRTLEAAYGVSGAVAFLCGLYRTTADEQHRRWATELGDVILRASQRMVGSNLPYWVTSGHVPGQPKAPYLGLMHGMAGIGLALVCLAFISREERFLGTAAQLGEALLSSAHRSEHGLRWPRVLGDSEPRLQAYCHGGIGVAHFLMCLHALSPNQRYIDACRSVAADISSSIPDDRHSGICHGQAGRGHYLLDCFEHFGDREFHDQAEKCAEQLEYFRDPMIPGKYVMTKMGWESVDLFNGSAGIGSFLLRLANPGKHPNPALPTVADALLSGRPSQKTAD